MRIALALAAAAFVLMLAFNMAVKSVLGPGIEQAVSNVEALDSLSRSDPRQLLKSGVGDRARRSNNAPPPRARPQRPVGGDEEIKPGGWGAAPAR